MNFITTGNIHEQNIQADTQETDHAILVVLDQFAHCLGIHQAFAMVRQYPKNSNP